MKTKFVSLLAVFLGLIIIVFPLMGVIGASSLIGLSALLMSIDYNSRGAILDLVLGLLLLFVSICLIFNPALLGFLTELSMYFSGIMLIIVAVVSLINNRNSRYGFYTGILGIILGLLYIIVGTYLSNPIILGTFIGVWLVINGILNFMDR